MNIDLPTFRLTLRSEPSSVPATVRVRRLLKIAGRCLGLKCVKAEELPPTDNAGKEPSPSTRKDA